MNDFTRLIVWEYKIHNKIHNLAKYLFGFLFFCSCSISLINSQADIQRFGIILSVIYLPLALIGFTSIIFKSDLDDGSLELMLVNFSPIKVVSAKFISLFISSLLGAGLNLPFIALIFNVDLISFWHLLSVFLLLLSLTSSLVILIATIQSYFRANTNFLSILIMPLLMPGIIIAGIILQDNTESYLIFSLIGFNLIIIPCCLSLASYLLGNIYNI